MKSFTKTVSVLALVAGVMLANGYAEAKTHGRHHRSHRRHHASMHHKAKAKPAAEKAAK